MFARFPFETVFRTGSLQMARKIITLFHRIGIERTLVFGAINLRKDYIIVNTGTCIVVEPYILHAKRSIVMQALFTLVVLEDSD